MKLLRLLFALLTLTLSSSAFAAIKVNTLRVFFHPGSERFQDVYVKNIGAKTDYVHVTVFKRTDPAKNPNLLEKAKGNPKTFGMLATPSKMALKPGQSRRIRAISFVKGNKNEEIFVIRVEPVKSPLKTAKVEDKKVAGVQVVASYDVTAYVLPAKPTTHITVKRDGKKLTFTNTGNTSGLVFDLEQCKSLSDTKSCKPVEMVKRIYAHSSWSFELPKAEPAKVKMMKYDSSQKELEVK